MGSFRDMTYEAVKNNSLATVTNLITYSEGEVEDKREERRCVSQDKNKMSEMKSIWCRVERGAEKEIRGTRRGGEVESVLDLCGRCRG